MSFLPSACSVDVVRYGDRAIFYVGHRSLLPVLVARGAVFQCRFGALRHDDVVGKWYGAKVRCRKGHVFVLRATPELWTVALPHRTQILYFADIALVSAALELRPGSLVAEAGTGSGSLTHSLARSVHPHGRVYSFDFHQVRVADAAQELARHGLQHLVVCAVRDVCSDGFPDPLRGRLHALFLDLPHPWHCIPAAHAVLRSGARVACFSPCVEQVAKTTAALRHNKFRAVATFESLIRPVRAVKRTSLKQLLLSPDPNQHDNGDDSVATDESIADPEEPDESVDESVDEQFAGAPNTPLSPDYTVCFPSATTAGHTGFLTFATKQ